MDHEMNGKRVHMYSNKNDMEHNTHQDSEIRSRDEEHTGETIIMIIFIYFIFIFCYLFFGFLFQVVVFIDLYVYIFYYILNIL